MYKLHKSPTNASFLIRTEDNAFIPFDQDNTDFVEYQKWLSEGNTPLPADEPTTEE